MKKWLYITVVSFIFVEILLYYAVCELEIFAYENSLFLASSASNQEELEAQVANESAENYDNNSELEEQEQSGGGNGEQEQSGGNEEREQSGSGNEQEQSGSGEQGGENQGGETSQSNTGDNTGDGQDSETEQPIYDDYPGYSEVEPPIVEQDELIID